MSQQYVHLGTTVTRVYGIMEDGSVGRTVPLEARCTKPTSAELIEANDKIEAKWAEVREQIEAEAAHAAAHEQISNGRQWTEKRAAEEPAPAG